MIDYNLLKSTSHDVWFERVQRVEKCRDLIEDLSYQIDMKGLNIRDCDSFSYSHFHDNYPQEIFDAFSNILDILDDWLDDLSFDLCEIRNLQQI